MQYKPKVRAPLRRLLTLPIALGWGAGAESHRPLGLAVVGGLAFSQIVTPDVTPVFYTYIDKFQRRFKRKPTAPRQGARRRAPRAPAHPHSACAGPPYFSYTAREDAPLPSTVHRDRATPHRWSPGR